MQIRNIMTDNVSSVQQDASINEAARIMKDLNVGAVPVCTGNRPVGIVTDRDIAIRNSAGNGDVNTQIQDIMSRELIFATPEMSEREAAELMALHQVRRLPVVENKNLVGMVSLGDLAVRDKSDMEAARALSNISVPSRPQR